MMYRRPRYLPAGDEGLLIEFGNKIHPDIHHRVYTMAGAVEEATIQGVEGIILSYRSLLVAYDPLVISFKDLTQGLKKSNKAFPIPRLPNIEGSKSQRSMAATKIS
jgi:allophanate hydrolase subunit 1